MSLFLARRLLRDGVVVTLALLGWSVLASFTRGALADALLFGGLAMATLYVLRRADEISTSIEPAYEDRSAEGILRENWTAFVVALPWFVFSALATVLGPGLEDLIGAVGFVGVARWIESLVEGLAFGFAGAGAELILLFAVAKGLAAYRSSERRNVADVRDSGTAQSTD